MDIKFGELYAISEKGHRINNEDSLFPEPESAKNNQRLFMVCDGVGGSEKGEIASDLACQSLASYFSTFLEGSLNAKFMDKALLYTEAKFEDYIRIHPESKGMATTLCLAHFCSNGVTIAHLGDSRVYQFRKGKILFKTEDHTLVNTWLKMGSITPEKAAVHPQRNVITRAIVDTENHVQADLSFIQDILPGDYIFLCSDGVLESFSDEELSQLFEECTSSAQLKNKILEKCERHSRDNFSYYIIPIRKTDDSSNLKQNLVSFFYSLI